MNEPIQYAVSTSIPSRSTGEAGDSELRRDIVAELCALLGDDVVLLPVQSGSKSPKIKNWQTLTAEDMRRAEYRAELSRSGNVGVLLGNGLITIDLDQDSAVKSFLVLNPKLSGTLRTRRVRGNASSATPGCRDGAPAAWPATRRSIPGFIPPIAWRWRPTGVACWR